jgi:ATP-dependent DNA ligase I
MSPVTESAAVASEHDDTTDPVGGLPLLRLALVSTETAATSSRLKKRDLIAGLLQEATPAEVGLVAGYLTGSPRQRRTGIGWRAVASPPEPASAASLTVLEVDARLDDISRLAGSGSVAIRATAVAELFGAAAASEQAFLQALITGELRQGALEGVMIDAIAQAFGIESALVRRAAMLSGSTPRVAELAAAGGAAALAEVGLTVGVGIKPMLASSAPDLATALAGLETSSAEPGAPRLAVDGKLDGIRVQVHRDGEDIQVFSRTLDDITARVGEVVRAARALPANRVVLDGEALTLGSDGRAQPFQVSASRVATRGTSAEQVPLSVFFFDLLHLDGEDLIDEPAQVRFERLAQLVPDQLLVPRLVSSDAAAIEAFGAEMLSIGHEGVVVKALDAPYQAGRRGASWIKVKPRHTLDLVVLAVEWGSGRRRGKLSNIHLGARDPSGGFVMLGKTFKGMTDEMLAWQTEHFLDLAIDREAASLPGSWVVRLRPEQVVEIAFDGIQTSSRYPGGMALRFARVLRYRDDKTADQADTIDTVRALHDTGSVRVVRDEGER